MRNYLGLEIRQKVWEQTPHIIILFSMCLAILWLIMYNYWLPPSPIFKWYEDFNLHGKVNYPIAAGQPCWLLGKRAGSLQRVCPNYFILVSKKRINCILKWIAWTHRRHFLFANATVSFNQLVSTYPGPLMLVSILVSVPTSLTSIQLELFIFNCWRIPLRTVDYQN